MLMGDCMHTDANDRGCGKRTSYRHPTLGMPVCDEHRDCFRPPRKLTWPLDEQPSKRACMVVDIWSERADLWAADNLVALCARVDGCIEVFKNGPGPILKMQLTAPGLTDDELWQKWEQIRDKASGGARGSG